MRQPDANYQPEAMDRRYAPIAGQHGLTMADTLLGIAFICQCGWKKKASIFALGASRKLAMAYAGHLEAKLAGQCLGPEEKTPAL